MFYSSCPHLLDNITLYSNRTERFNISINGSLCCSGANRTERFNISTNGNLCCPGCSCCVIFENIANVKISRCLFVIAGY